MKKIIALALTLVMIFALAVPAASAQDAKTVKVGFIFLHDEQSTYDLNFMKAAQEACEKLGIEYINKVGIPEGQECYEAAMDLVDEGCNIVFADSFGHEDYMIQAAMECPDVEFCHATGTRAHTEGLANYHNAFASIYEGRFLAGIAAGLKLQEMITGQDRLCRRLHLRRSDLRLHLLLPRCPSRCPRGHHGSHLHRFLVRSVPGSRRCPEAD